MRAIWELVKALPAMVSLFSEILRALKNLSDELERSKRAEKLKEAIKDAREKKDTSKLDDFFGGSKPSDTSGNVKL